MLICTDDNNATNSLQESALPSNPNTLLLTLELQGFTNRYKSALLALKC